MKKRKDRKPFILLGLCVVTLLLSWLYVQIPKAVPENPIQGVCDERTHMPYMGEGYPLKLEAEEPEVLEETEPETETETELETEIVYETELIYETETFYETENQLEESKIEENTGEESQGQEENTEKTTESGKKEETEMIPDTTGTESEEKSSEKTEGPAEEDNTIIYTPTNVGEETEGFSDDDRNQSGAELPEEIQETELITETEQIEETETENKYPLLATDLTDQETVPASYRSFVVEATDWEGNALGSEFLNVTGNGNRLYATSDDGSRVTYRLDLQEGANTVVITVTDSEGRSSQVSVTLYKGEQAEQEPAGYITFSLEATTLGLGYLIGPVETGFYEGEQFSYVLDRVLTDNGFTYHYDGTLSNGFYLRSIERADITEGFHIPEDLEQKLLEVNCPINDYHYDSLGEFDFTGPSGWMYEVNGVMISSGISTYYPADGDQVRLRFSLYSGADIGHAMTGQTWGDW